jgi:hypothetical protein
MNLPYDILREIASKDPQVRKEMSRAISSYKRTTMPIGLAVTKVGSKIISPNRRVINRSTMKKQKKEPFASVLRRPVNAGVPAALKNKNWKFYTSARMWPSNVPTVVFYNSKNGQGFMINKKTGARKPTQGRFNFIQNRPKESRKSTDTYQAYLKRANKAKRIFEGQESRTKKKNLINANVKVFLNTGNKSVLNKWTFSDLLWWSRHTSWANGHYVKLPGLKWTHPDSGRNVTRNSLLEDIQILNSMRN